MGALILLQTHSVPKRDEGTRIIYFLALILGVVLLLVNDVNLTHRQVPTCRISRPTSDPVAPQKSNQ